jgi:flagellin-like protein
MIKTRRSTRGLSPIFAVLILIAIAVIAGIVVYMFTSGFIGSLTGNPSTGSEKVAIQAIQGTGQTITVYAMSQSGGPIALDSAIVKNAQGGTIEVITLDPAADIIESSLTTLPITTVNALTPGSSYSVQLVSVAGGNFPSQSFKAT